MNINVTTTKVSIDNESLNKGEYNVRECNFDLTEEYEGLVCKALFTVTKTKLTYEQSIVNGKCNIPYEATVNRGKVIVGVIGYEVNNEELVKRYSPEPDEFFVLDGSYVEDIENQSTPTPTEIEQLEQRVSAVEIDAEQVEINTQNISDLQENKADKSELEDFITKDVNDLTYYTLTTQTGSQIELSLNSTNFKMTATLKDKNGTVVNTSNEIDLPLESVVVNASYDSTTKEIVLTLQNGNTVRVSVADLVSGLVSDTDYATSSKGGVIKVNDYYKATSVTDSGALQAETKTYAQYNTMDNSAFVGKGTLENAITGKGLVSDTDYATASKGGVIKVSGNDYGLGVYNGFLYPLSQTYANYQNKYNDFAISKGTLENVITGKELVNETQLNTKADKSALVTGSGENITLNKTAELDFIQPPLPRGNSEQVQYSGKNKLNATQESWTLAANTTVYQAIVTAANKPYLEAGTKYYFSYNVDNASSSNTRSTLRLYLNQEYIQNQTANANLTAGRKVWEFTPTVSGNYEVQYWLQGSNVAVTVSDFMISTSSDTTYEPYVGGTASPNPSYPQEITNVTGDVEVLVQNKNLLKLNVLSNNNYNNNSYAVIGNIAEFKCNYYVERELSIGETFINQKVLNTSDCTTTIKLKGLLPNTQYTISGDVSTNITGSVLILGTNYATVPNKVNNIIITDANGEKTLTHFYIATRTAGMYLNISNIQLEPGTAKTTYTPHKEQTYTFPLGTQRMYAGDYLADDGIHHVRGEYTVTGNESIGNFEIASNGCFAVTLGIKCKYGVYSGDETYWLADKLKAYSLAKLRGSTPKIGICVLNDGFTYVNLTGEASTRESAIASWNDLAGMKIEYLMQNEEITPYTTEQQAAYDEIKQALSYEEQTNISGSSDESNPLFEVQAVQYKEPDYWTIAYVNAQIGNAIGGAY